MAGGEGDQMSESFKRQFIAIVDETGDCVL